ncbi:MAG: AAA family ATPase, partial [Methylobacter sp.]|nr:AAA family ATPase [Methylobacter sp.]
MKRKKLPIGIQTFAKIREDNHYYVDKTQLIAQLIADGSHYFLSRPRRFGKSLLIDTLGELFAGNEPLFKGLFIHDQWDWSIKYPVIRLSFGGGVMRNSADLDDKTQELLNIAQKSLGIACTEQSQQARFAELIRGAHEKTGQRVVILVDEYDKPILDNLANPQVAREIR